MANKPFLLATGIEGGALRHSEASARYADCMAVTRTL